MEAMYPAQAYSPQTTLAANINSTDTTITVVDGSVLPNAPNLLTLGNYGDPVQETILYAVKTGNVLSGITRAVEGQATSWDAGTSLSRNFTALDYEALRANISDLGANKEPTLTPSSMAGKTLPFTEAVERVNVNTGETLGIIFGKIKRFFTDLKSVAFSGSYTDLTNKPTTLPPATHALSHKTGGLDALTAADIGAAAAAHDHNSAYAAQTHNHDTAYSPLLFPWVTVSGSLTLGLDKANTGLACFSATAMVVTVPANASVPFPIGTQVALFAEGAGTVSVAAASGVTIVSKDDNRVLDGQYAGATLVKRSADTWWLYGGLTS